MSNDNNETRKVNTSNIKKRTQNKSKNSKSNKGKKIKFKDKHPKISTAIKTTILLIIILAIIGAGMLVGAFVGIFGDELKIDEASLVVGAENSTVYDADGNLIATLSGGTKRKSISLTDMSEYLPKAYVAIEDERFYKHSGIDITRTAYATVTYILHAGKSSFGGSTITQQVIKNITQDKERTALAGVMRKVKEISKAIQVEHYLSKDQILELYLNLIFVGGNDINGVELGSIYYFDKSAKDLSIAECAYMAGINHSPSGYKPFEEYADSENPAEKKENMANKIKKRTKTVLGKMKEVGYINDEQYKQAVEEVDNGLHFKKGESASVTVDVSYHTEAAIDQIIDQMLEENEDMTRNAAERYLYSGGLKIYTTQKTEIQTVLEEEIVKDKYWTKATYQVKNKETGKKEDKTQYSTPTMVIQDHKTGQVVAAATATGSKEERTAKTKLGYLNFPTEIKKQTGSSMKPISVIAPGLETGTITGATVYIDQPTTWGKGADAWNPKNFDKYRGLLNMREAIGVSANIPHAKALTDIGLKASTDFCKSVGMPDFSKEGLSLALGGLDDGISPAHMAGAYSAIANDGVYITPTFYTKVTDSQGNVKYEAKQEKNKVMSEQNAYIEKSILTEPVIGTHGNTASYCKIPGMDVAAKTGTSNSSVDRWLCGFTPYFTAASWYGYEFNSTVKASGNPAGNLWAAVMKAIHKDLENAKFEEPDGIIKQSVCRESGKLATAACGGNVYTELFTEDSLPKDACDAHTGTRICNDSGLLATAGCPNVRSAYLPDSEKDKEWVTQGAIAIPTGTCTIHQSVSGYVTPEDQARFQAATDADAMGLTGKAREDYINNAGNAAKAQQQAQQTQQQNPPAQSTQQTQPPAETTPPASNNGTTPTAPDTSSNSPSTDGGTGSPPASETQSGDNGAQGQQ